MLPGFSLLLSWALWAAPPKVSVDTASLEGVDARFPSWLLLRLLEEGYAIAPSESVADVRLRVRSVDDGVSVEAQGRAREEYRLAPSSSGSLMLEVLQRAVLVLDRAGQREEVATKPVRSLRLAAHGEVTSISTRVEEALASNLSSAGFVLVGAQSPHDVAVCFGMDGERLALGVAPASEPCRESTLSCVGTTPDELPACAAVQAEALVAAAFSPVESTLKPVRPPPSPPSPPSPLSPPSRDEPPRAQRSAVRAASARDVSFGVAAGPWLRGGGVDPLVMAHSDLSLRGEARVRFQVGASWSSAQPTLSIIEAPLQTGVAWSRPLGSSLGVGAALLGGVLVHYFDYDANDRGVRVNAVVSFVNELWFREGSFRVRFGLLPTLSGPARDHRVLGGETWRRSAFSVAALAGIEVLP